MKSKRKSKENKTSDRYKKQDVEDAILVAFNKFVDSNPKGGNVFELLNMVFAGLKKLDVPSAVVDLKPAIVSEKDFEEELREATTKV